MIYPLTSYSISLLINPNYLTLIKMQSDITQEVLQGERNISLLFQSKSKHKSKFSYCENQSNTAGHARYESYQPCRQSGSSSQGCRLQSHWRRTVGASLCSCVAPPDSTSRPASDHDRSSVLWKLQQLFNTIYGEET